MKKLLSAPQNELVSDTSERCRTFCRTNGLIPHFAGLIFSLAFCTLANAQFTKLLDFAGATNGSNPNGSLISDGTFLYGMTYAGGTNDMGVIFKIKPDGSNYVKLLDFVGANGNAPFGSLISDGTFLYGMTYAGGTNNDGTLFKIMSDGSNYVKLLDFDFTNGGYPEGSLISDGIFLYGMTGGQVGTNNNGTVFKIKPDGSNYVKLLDFTGTTNGSNPRGSLISDGTFLYGMTRNGGTSGYGTIFKIQLDGSNYLKLLDFAGAINGSAPSGSLISDGTFLYGMTRIGGTHYEGTIFKIQLDGSNYVKLLDFADATNGSAPFGSLISDGTFLYGMTEQGGTNDYGVLFKIKLDGSNYVKLLDFANDTLHGTFPRGSLLSDGTFLYGMTPYGGTSYKGVIFKYALATGVAEELGAESPEFSIYPNPGNGKFTLSFNHSTIQPFNHLTIYNVLGEIVYQSQISNLNTQYSIKQPKGIYFVQIQSEEKISTQKLIVE